MKKNFVRVMLFGALTLAVSTTVTSCKDYDDDIKGLQEQVDNIKSTNPVSTEDMKAAVEEATKALEKKVSDLKAVVDGKVTTTDLEAKIKELEKALAAGDKTVADDLIAAKNELQLAINGKASQSTVDAMNEDITALKEMKTTLQALIDAENKFKADHNDLSGFENTSFDKFINQSIINALKDEGDSKGEIAAYVIKTVQDGVASNGKALNDHIEGLGITGVTSLTDFVDKIYNEIFKEDGVIKSKLDDLDELLQAINAYVGSGEGQLADYQTIIDEIMATRDAVTALALPEGKNLTQAVQDIIATELGDAKATLGKLQTELKAEITALKGMIQSIVYVPESADRIIEFTSLKVAETSQYTTGISSAQTWHEVGNTLEKKVRFRISPASAVAELTKADSKYTITTDAQVLTRAAGVFTVGAVKAVANEPNLIEVTLKANAIEESKGYAVALTVIGKDDKTEYSDISSDYFAMIQQTLHINKIDFKWVGGTEPNSLIIENKEDKIDYAAGSAYEFTVTLDANGTSTNQVVKTADQLGIDLSKFKVTYAKTGANEAKFTLKDGVLTANADAAVGNVCQVTPTITVTHKDGTTELKGTAYAQVTLTSKGAPVALTFDKLKWNSAAKVYTLTADGTGADNLAGLTAILTALGTTGAPASNLSGATSVSDPADNAVTPCMILESNAVKIKVPANYVTTSENGIDKVSVILTKDNKTVTVSADIKVSATAASELVWDWNSLNSTPGQEMMIMSREGGDNVSSVKLTRNLTQAYEASVFTDLNKRKTAGEIVIAPAISPAGIGSVDGSSYVYTITAGTVDYSYKKEGKANPISVTFGVTSNGKSIAPADNKNVVNMLMPVDELNGTLTLPKIRLKETSTKADEIELSKAFNPAAESEKNGYNFTWKDSRGKEMWPTNASGQFNVSDAKAALKLYGLSISFEPKSADDFKKYFDVDELKDNGKVKLNTATAAQEIIGSDISAVVVLKATSKWGDVAGDGTEFTVTFKKGAK
ncbi:hypothetical protein [Bacteroides xylanisolvens]|uniref:hypothetical protein n=1 Tax=Bacteroides xylanisolvens TaxID=371601 RepID=UPI003561BEC2